MAYTVAIIASEMPAASQPRTGGTFQTWAASVGSPREVFVKLTAESRGSRANRANRNPKRGDAMGGAQRLGPGGKWVAD